MESKPPQDAQRKVCPNSILILLPPKLPVYSLLMICLIWSCCSIGLCLKLLHAEFQSRKLKRNMSFWLIPITNVLAWMIFFSCVIFSNMFVVCSEKVENVDTLQAMNLMKQFQACIPQFCYFLLLRNLWIIWFNFLLFRFFYMWFLCIFHQKRSLKQKITIEKKGKSLS